MNTEQKQELSSFEQHELELEAEAIKNALTAKYADEEHIEKRLAAIADNIRHYSQETVEQKWPELAKERKTFLASAGELDPWIFLQQVGFQILRSGQGNAAIKKLENGTELRISHGYHPDKSKLMITKVLEKNNQQHQFIPLPKSIDDLYQLFSDHSWPIYNGSAHRAKYEANYVKALKNQKTK